MASIIKPIGGLAPHLNQEDIGDLAEANARTLLRHLNYQPREVYRELLRYQHYLDTLVACLRPAATASEPVTVGTFLRTPKPMTLSVTVHDTPDGPAGTDWWMLDRKLEPTTPPKEARQVLLPPTGGPRSSSGLSA